MALDIFQRIQTSLDEKRHNVTEFLETATEIEKDVCLCDDDHCVQEHMHVIETSIEKLGSETLVAL